jgi:hypothetical protein
MSGLLCCCAALASTNRRPNDVCNLPIVVAELKLRNVKRQVFLADLVIAADDAEHNQRPEALNGVGVNRADNMLARFMVNDAVIVAVMSSRG